MCAREDRRDNMSGRSHPSPAHKSSTTALCGNGARQHNAAMHAVYESTARSPHDAAHPETSVLQLIGPAEQRLSTHCSFWNPSLATTESRPSTLSQQHAAVGTVSSTPLATTRPPCPSFHSPVATAVLRAQTRLESPLIVYVATPYLPLYSRKLHIRVRRARTSWVTSLTILALVLDGSVWNHFARRTLPVGVSGS